LEWLSAGSTLPMVRSIFDQTIALVRCRLLYGP
jgi:hypothetical protein